MNLTLKEITSERDWSGQYGDMHAFKILFDDGTHAEVTTKAATVEKRRTELQALIGKPGEYTLEDQGDFPDGKPKPKKVTDYPGKPKGDGGGKGYSLSLADRLELDRFKEMSTNARTAVMQAVTMLMPVTREEGVDAVLITASRILDWLQSKGSESVRTSPPTTDLGKAGTGDLSPSVSAPSSGGESAYQHQELPDRGSASDGVVGDTPSASPESSEEVEVGDKQDARGASASSANHPDQAKCAHEWGPAPSGNKRIRYCPKCEAVDPVMRVS